MVSAPQDQWVERLQPDSDDREQAIAELREVILRGLTRTMAGRYGGSLQPDDVVQEAMIKILNSLDKFAGRSRFTTWAMTIATRVAISELRRKHYQDVSLNAIAPDESLRIEVPSNDAPPPGNAMDRRAILARLQETIAHKLTERQQFAVRGQLEGLPVEEIARRIGSNRNAVYKLIHDARLRLRTELESAGIAGDDVNSIFA